MLDSNPDSGFHTENSEQRSEEQNDTNEDIVTAQWDKFLSVHLIPKKQKKKQKKKLLAVAFFFNAGAEKLELKTDKC